METGKSLAIKWVDGEYEKAVDEQKKELREYKKRAKSQTQLPEVEPVPLTVELIEVVSPEQEDQSKNLMQEPISV